MHIVHTFVVRLFVDPQAPGLIKGSIQDIFGAAPIPFTDLQTMLEIYNFYLVTTTATFDYDPISPEEFLKESKPRQ